MKKFTFILLSGLSVGSIAQNIDENKVTFGYVQLPENPIDKQYKTYNVVVDRAYEKSNEDSLFAYQNRLQIATTQYELDLSVWLEQKKATERVYLSQMAAWQKGTDAGQALAQPLAPVYPAKPIMQEVLMPKLHSDVTNESVSNLVSLEGYSKAEGGATVTFGMNPISEMAIVFERKVTGTTTKYNYSANYKLPITLKVESPSQGLILNTIVQNTVLSYPMPSYDSQYDFDLWWLDNEETFWIEFETNVRNSAVSAAKAYLNDKCGYPIQTRYAEVYTVKSFKDHNYNDLTNAYTTATAGYMTISGSLDHSAAQPKLNEAIAVWLQMLKESNLSDNKSRVNDKVTAMLYCNLAEAYCWLNQFDKANQYLNLAKASGEGKFKRIAEGMTSTVEDNQRRFNANK